MSKPETEAEKQLKKMDEMKKIAPKYEELKTKIKGIHKDLEPFDLTYIVSSRTNSPTVIKDLYHYIFVVDIDGNLLSFKDDNDTKPMYIETPVQISLNGFFSFHEYDDTGFNVHKDEYIFGLPTKGTSKPSVLFENVKKNLEKKGITLRKQDRPKPPEDKKGGKRKTYKKQTRRNKPKNRRRSRRWFF